MSQNNGYGRDPYQQGQGYDGQGQPPYQHNMPPHPGTGRPHGMNPNAQAFQFNPNAQSFVPGGFQGGYAQGPPMPRGPPPRQGGGAYQGAPDYGYQQQYARPPPQNYAGGAPPPYHGGPPAPARPAGGPPGPPPGQPPPMQSQPYPPQQQAAPYQQVPTQKAGAPAAAPGPPPPAAPQKEDWEGDDDDDEEDGPDLEEYMEEQQKGVSTSSTTAISGGAAVTATINTSDGKQKAEVETVTKQVEKVEIVEDSTPQDAAEREKLVKETLDSLKDGDTRQHLNVVFIGHVDAGKSTLCGQILFLTGNVDQRTIERYEKEAKEKNRESWYFAYVMDINEEEKAKGKTVEVGRAHFQTESRRFTILDAPGHKNYVPNMIMGTAQADVGLLVIAARKGEFETGFEGGGQTREHAQLAKTLGVNRLVVVVNKMDDPSVTTGTGTWSQERFQQIEGQLGPFLKSCGYNVKKDVKFVPVSGMTGLNIKEPVPKDKCDWWTGGTLFETLNNLEPSDRDPYKPVRLPVMDRFKDMGVVVMGKLEQGLIKMNDTLLVQPVNKRCKVVELSRDDDRVEAVVPGENVRLKVQGIEEDDVAPGHCLVLPGQLTPVTDQFEAQVKVLDLLEHKSIFSTGYQSVLHLHNAVLECEVTRILSVFDTKTKQEKPARYVRSNSLVKCRIRAERQVPMETFDVLPQMGRFTLRDEGRTIAIGKVTRVPKQRPT